MAADGLAPSITESFTAMVLTMQGERFLVFHKE